MYSIHFLSYHLCGASSCHFCASCTNLLLSGVGASLGSFGHGWQRWCEPCRPEPFRPLRWRYLLVENSSIQLLSTFAAMEWNEMHRLHAEVGYLWLCVLKSHLMSFLFCCFQLSISDWFFDVFLCFSSLALETSPTGFGAWACQGWITCCESLRACWDEWKWNDPNRKGAIIEWVELNMACWVC